MATTKTGIRMKAKTAARLANAWLEALEANQLSAHEVVQALFDAPFPAKYKKLLRIGRQTGWMRTLMKMPEPDKEQLAQVLAMFDALKNAPGKMRALLKQRIKELPRERGGAPRKIRVEQELTVCAEVEALRSEYDTRGAIGIVAAKRRVSERTIYRIWGKYHPKKKGTRASS